jgi:phosphoribosylaminoimidazole carboxylase PurE protein
MTHDRGGRVIVLLGSPADREWGQRIVAALERFHVESQVRVASAHKTPEYLLELLRDQETAGGDRVYIAVAGRSNALSGFVDAQVVAPVIACPPSSEAFGGMDILSSLRMPRGVASMVVLEPENAALAAAKILAAGEGRLRDRIVEAQDAERQRVMGGLSEAS